MTVRTTGQPLQPDSWHHVLIWYDHINNSLNLCIDGGETISSWAPFGVNMSQKFCTLGSGPLSANEDLNWFHGLIDEFSFMRGRLENYELEAFYNKGLGLTYPFGSPMNSEDHLRVASLTFDAGDVSDSPLRDQLGGGTAADDGIIGASRHYDSSLEQSDQIKFAGTCDARGSFTVSFWSRLESELPGAHPILGKPSQSGRSQYAFYRTNKKIGVELGLTSSVVHLEGNCDGSEAWVHLSLRVNSDTQQASLSIDGKLAANTILSEDFLPPGGALQLGTATLMEISPSAPSFNGTLDQFTFHRRILSPREIQSFYLLGKGVACWGDSFTAGPNAIRYSQVLESSRGIKVSNHGYFGISGTELNKRMALNTIQSAWVTVIWIGWTTHTRNDSLSITENGLAAMVQQLHERRPNPRFVILNIPNHHHPDWESGGENHPDYHRNLIAPINEMIATTYPDNYIDLDDYFINQYETADPLDLMDQAIGIVPRSLRINLDDGDQNYNDDTHLTSEGYAEVASLINLFLNRRGW